MSFPQLTSLPCGSESSVIVRYPVPEFIKPFSCSTQLNMTFQLHMKAKMVDKKDFYCYKNLTCCYVSANKCKNVNNCWHLNIYEQNKFHAQLS